MLTKAPRGTRDVLPAESGKWNYVETRFREICRRYGFFEVRTPTFEHTELFKRSVGDTTDIVEKQMYSFDDNGGRNITLKPEGTAGVARAYIENKMYAGTQPVKLFYITPCFRYERPQAGRLREFHQFGIEAFGAASSLVDAEVIGVAIDFFADLGITNLELRINSVGCPTCRKIYREKLQEYLRDRLDDLCETCKNRFDRNPMRILDCKSATCQESVHDAPRMLDYLCDPCKEDFESLKGFLGQMNIEYIVDPDIVRGLDYYTKTAFEIVSKEIGAQGTVCGGGRYDNLISQMDGPPTPGVGFGLGIERLLLTLEKSGIEIPVSNKCDILIAYMGEKAKIEAIKLVRKLRIEGVSAQLDLLDRSLKAQLKYSDKLDSLMTAIIGEDELAEGNIVIKDMKKSEQYTIKMDKFIEEAKNYAKRGF